MALSPHHYNLHLINQAIGETTDRLNYIFIKSQHPKDDELTKRAALAVVDRLNNLTSVNRKLCLVYELRYIKSAYINQRYDISVKNLKELIVTIGVKPSDAEFSSTVHLFVDDPKRAEVKGVSRVSLYGSSANCVADFEMRLYCSCKGLTRMT